MNEPYKKTLVGDIKSNLPLDDKVLETILIELESFMIKHHIDKIDIGWSRDALMKSQAMVQCDISKLQ